ncbi:uncharacterized protein EI90DRAFT_141944 [Cantharellus anzutake]|uniref:uncharacterized protein n=1 Tax=Cantharellus anzutake TaxID=1750568 RepID=UPI00190614F2|nr:uncharacterized protein EI90DRAFT_141944 [Cantharellus anzutake]KAF8317769.1 hypothetical protein EI90DRAFT_141944 [Cantharellus anzutake]
MHSCSVAQSKIYIAACKWLLTPWAATSDLTIYIYMCVYVSNVRIRAFSLKTYIHPFRSDSGFCYTGKMTKLVVRQQLPCQINQRKRAIICQKLSVLSSSLLGSVSICSPFLLLYLILIFSYTHTSPLVLRCLFHVHLC